MPFTRISLLEGKPAAYLEAITEALDRALVEAFDVPEGDRFVVIHQHRPGELIFDRDYGGGPRSNDYVLFHITTGRPRSAETKQRLYQRLVERLGEGPGLRPEDVMVVISNSTLDDWSFSHGRAASATA